MHHGGVGFKFWHTVSILGCIAGKVCLSLVGCHYLIYFVIHNMYLQLFQVYRWEICVLYDLMKAIRTFFDLVILKDLD